MYLFKNKNVSAIILSIITSFLIESYITIVENFYLIEGNYLHDFINLFSYKEFIIFFILFIIVYYILLDDDKKDKVFNFIYKYRYPLSLILIAIAVLFQIHGSSISELHLNSSHHTLFGIPRAIRSDEFNVNTMLAFSQYPNNFSYFSEIVRGSLTDMFIVYGQPAWDVGMLFRPFLIGYLFLNQGQGLSFFWMGRLIVLFLISFEFGMLITNYNKKLALAYTFLITFSPMVQWWFAINGLVEMLIFGQLGILLINYYMTMDDYKKRFITAFGLMVCAGTFILVFYPSWQIPFGYVFILLAFWIFFKNKSQFNYNRKDLIIFIVCLAIFSIIMIHILFNSLETIKLILHSAYPGGMKYNGGGDLFYFVKYIPSIIFAMKPNMPALNVVELSSFIDFFPIPIILSGIVLFYQKTKDKLLMALLALYLVLFIFYAFPLPEIITKLTLRDHIFTPRLFVVIGFLGCLMLIRAIADLKEYKNKKIFAILSIGISAVMVYCAMFYFNVYLPTWLIPLLFILYSIVYTIIFLSSSDKGKTIFLITCIILTLSAGALVNPVEHGTDMVFESNYIQEVQHLVDENPNASWLVMDSVYLNTLIPTGAKTINSIHTYPDFDKWSILDPNNEYFDVYNRYAHVVIILNNDTPTNFQLASQDIIHLYLNVNDLEKLNITYIAATIELTQLSNENVTISEIYHDGEFKIYKVTYN